MFRCAFDVFCHFWGGGHAARVERLGRMKSFQNSPLKHQAPLTSVSFRTPPHMRLTPSSRSAAWATAHVVWYGGAIRLKCKNSTHHGGAGNSWHGSRNQGKYLWKRIMHLRLSVAGGQLLGERQRDQRTTEPLGYSASCRILRGLSLVVRNSLLGRSLVCIQLFA